MNNSDDLFPVFKKLATVDSLNLYIGDRVSFIHFMMNEDDMRTAASNQFKDFDFRLKADMFFDKFIEYCFSRLEQKIFESWNPEINRKGARLPALTREIRATLRSVIHTNFEGYRS